MMWCDDFDMDLPKVIPSAREALGVIGDIDLVTHGHETGGKLNHPSVWNHDLGMVSFFWRPGRTPKPAGYWTNDPLVHCTLWEALRDAWCHSNVILLEGKPVWKSLDEHFMPLMYDLRGWHKLSDSDRENRKFIVLDAIVTCGGLVERYTEPPPMKARRAPVTTREQMNKERGLAMSDTPKTDALESGIEARKRARTFHMPEDLQDALEHARSLERALARAEGLLRACKPRIESFGSDMSNDEAALLVQIDAALSEGGKR